MTVVGTADFTIVIDGNWVAVTVSESLSVTDGPVGGVPDAVAVFTIDPASMFAKVTVYDAVHVVDTKGARVDAGQLTTERPGSGSVTPTEVNVTLPVLVTRNEYATVWPAAVTVVGSADLSIEISGSEVAGTVAESVSVTSGPLGGVPDAVAVLTIEPASTSDCVTV